jgi:hypothetical protein
MRFSKRPIDPKNISAPVQLLSTTNMLTYNAPDIAVIQAQRKASSSVSSGSSSQASADESDASSTLSRSRDTHLTDTSSVGSISPVTSPQSEKRIAYFESTPSVKGASTLRRSISTLEIRHQNPTEEHALDPSRSESPAIPQRHPSRSKRSHADLTKKRSLQTIPAASITRTHSVGSAASAQKQVDRSSIDFFNGTVNNSTSSPATTAHPFGKELEQLDEVAEEFSGAINDVEVANDLEVMCQRCLVRFCAADYMAEIAPLFDNFSSSYLGVPAMAWI